MSETVPQEKPLMVIDVKVSNSVREPLKMVNNIISKMNEEHSGNYTLQYRVTFDFS